MDHVILDGDTVQFQAAFGDATVTVLVGTITGTGPATLGGKKTCIVGDEASVKVTTAYTSTSFSIPGSGTIEVEALGGDQKAQKSSSGKTKFILKGTQLTAKFTVSAPAQQPNTPKANLLDAPNRVYSGGQGSFVPTNLKFRAT